VDLAVAFLAAAAAVAAGVVGSLTITLMVEFITTLW
jgi:hypothetical protein